ncbi:hypothetical protein SAMN03159341_13117 [Paenibacillus sp. 1_12]|uniref:hypothetical protein n=1 Tax=Paenibacillus sp. 1_12 TaxID=1566278 RepID=UPI0008DF0B8C|nr:hypothetical protein [Paenibacillus sp. 1_12]SFM40296.1 hypothetical protein SAMN03159341_13117 [Paenibacillus sp. 1_12]
MRAVLIIEWIIIGLLAGAALGAFWENIKSWVNSIKYRIKSWSRMFIRKYSSNQQIITIESDTRIVSENEVPEEIRARTYQDVDITQKAKQLGILSH